MKSQLALSRSGAVCEVFHLTALAIWFGAILMAGGSAAVMFPAAKNLGIRLDGYQELSAEHWRIAAGQIQQRIFFVSDAVQTAAAGLAFATLGLRLIGFGMAKPEKRAATTLRTASVGVAVLLACFYLFVLAPRMFTNAKGYWSHGAAGDVATAREFQSAFDEDHPTASRVISATAGCVLVAFAACAWSLAAPRRLPVGGA